MSPSHDIDTRQTVNFRSVDSQPRGLSAPVSRLRAPALLLTFCILALIQLAVFSTGSLDWLFPQRDYVFTPYVGEHSIAVRTYIVSFYVAYSIYGSGSATARALFALELVFLFLTICALLDVANTLFLVLFGSPYPLTFVQILAGLIGFGLFSLMLVQRGVMPPTKPVETGEQHNLRMLLRIVAVATTAGAASAYVGLQDWRLIEGMRELTLLGGIGPGILLFLPTFFLQLYIIGLLERRLSAASGHAEPISVIVPAHNEAPIIAETIRHIDEAAQQFAAEVELIVLDNNSSDDTAEIARTAIAEGSAITGRVVAVPRPGKAHALNRGIEEAKHALVLRIDADTQIGPDNIRLAVQNFHEPHIGVVGGVPLPPGGGMFDRARLVEVLVKHGYYSPALSAFWGLIGVPGMFAIYRAEALRKAGRIATGMNGEDTDMSFRISELGYHCIVDYRVSYVSEVPATFAHMREQRMRWFRSVYHVSARGRSAILSNSTTIRGKLVLPYMLLNSGRRAMMVPILFFGLLQLLTASGTDNVLVWQSIIAVLVGAPALVAVGAILLNRHPAALLAMPEYLAFRALRSWYTLESVLSIQISRRSRRYSEMMERVA
ncbi:glycosyltransferase [Alteraurantiacibacter aquimixticola]|uniref:Glycosyltransferase family 2 protein n=1 Tax=Alteraurantiacibacter aquimixticola TaxID=2489173 RepID=A0A4T3F288_9SPHN|nr:glycosyltransferase [Alteraurantiacibacter aquimixticola]TIX50697.1 glycosyltransferase family 2 protein [Alteraurantiacibacter aquimixticola]